MHPLRKWLSKSERRNRCSSGTASRCSMRQKSRSKKYQVEFSTARASSGACAPDIPRVHGIVRGMLADQWCETTWRAQPGSFVSLMTLYESNFVRLGWLVSDLRAVTARRVSHVASDCDLHLTPQELSRYTSVFRLTYEFEFEAARVRDRIWRCACITTPGWPRCAASAVSSATRSSPSWSRDSSVNWISAGPET